MLKGFQVACLCSLLAAWCSAQLPPAFADSSEHALTAQDFAYARPLEISGQAALYSFEVPEDLYRIATRNDLGDVRIFNSAGAAVPHEVSRADSSVENSVLNAVVPIFPIEGVSSAGMGGGEVEISQDASGKMLRVWLNGKDASKKGDIPSNSYLLDLRSFKRPLLAFDIQTEELSPNKLIDVQIDGSTDLKSWQPVAATGVLARLTYLGQEVIQNRFEVSGAAGLFLRLSFPNGDKVSIASIKGEFLNSEKKIRPERWMTLNASSDPKVPSTFFYDSAGSFPVRSFRIVLPQLNTFVRMRLSSRALPSAAWTPRYSGTLYRLATKGGELASAAQTLSSSTTDRLWRLEIEGKDSQLGSGSPNLVLGWVPNEIFFMAQGQPPFQLAYGSARAGAPDFGVGGLSSASLGQGISAEAAVLGEAREVGGIASTVAPIVEEPLPWKKWILWAVLIGFLGMVGLMAARLAKDLKNS